MLAPWGSIAIELGDTYSGSGGAGGDYDTGQIRGGQNKFSGSALADRKNKVLNANGQRMQQGPGWPAAKSLALIPQLYAVSLAYGRNVLRVFDVDELLDVMQWWADDGYTAHDLVRMARLWSQSVRRVDNEGESPAGRWRVRNMIVWHRPNPAVGALGDKYRPSTSYIVVATRDAKRWFDLTAVRDRDSNTTRLVTGYAMAGGVPSHDTGPRSMNPAGAPPLDCWTDEYDHSHDTWTVTTQPSSLAHYAMWPARLAERLVLSMCPAEVCSACGTPRRRVERTEYRRSKGGTTGVRRDATEPDGNTRGMIGKPTLESIPVTLGWTDCGCGAPWTAGTVLDPFCGTFTTGLVAEAHGRNAIGIDLDPRNADLVPLRRQEVRRNLFGSPRVDPAQLDLFGGAA